MQEEPNNVPERNLLVEDVCCGGFFELYLSGTVSYDEKHHWYMDIVNGIRLSEEDDTEAPEGSFILRVFGASIKFCPMCGKEITFTDKSEDN